VGQGGVVTASGRAWWLRGGRSRAGREPKIPALLKAVVAAYQLRERDTSRVRPMSLGLDLEAVTGVSEPEATMTMSSCAAAAGLRVGHRDAGQRAAEGG
jgi:hypothetical protein